MNDPCFVYIMVIDQCGDLESQLVKVGISSSPSARLRGFQTSSPFKIEMPFTFCLPRRDDAAWVERTFHAENADLRVSGEWFRTDVIGAACDIDLLIGRCWVEHRCGHPAWLRRWLLQAGLHEEAISFVSNELEAA